MGAFLIDIHFACARYIGGANRKKNCPLQKCQANFVLRTLLPACLPACCFNREIGRLFVTIFLSILHLFETNLDCAKFPIILPNVLTFLFHTLCKFEWVVQSSFIQETSKLSTAFSDSWWLLCHSESSPNSLIALWRSALWEFAGKFKIALNTSEPTSSLRIISKLIRKQPTTYNIISLTLNHYPPQHFLWRTLQLHCSLSVHTPFEFSWACYRNSRLSPRRIHLW